jgi:peptide/nickel transport system substrate-binding protein
MKKCLVGLVVLSLMLSVFVGFNSISFAQKKYNEAPMLADLVKSGKLPPVEERLPEKPFVVGPGVLIDRQDLPDWEVGKYGGTLRMFFIGTSGGGDYFLSLNEGLLGAPGIGTKDIRGNILEDVKVSNNNRVFTFRMRKGLKWSDGYPVTTDDIRFTYEDVLLNEKLTPVFPSEYRSQGDPMGEKMKLEILDKYTFRISFKDRYGGFLTQLAIEGWATYSDLLKPFHYLKQFHIKYTPLEKLEPLIEKEGFASGEWWKLFNKKDCSVWVQDNLDAIGFPTLTPWIISPSSTSDVLVFERNPYYFKVDTAGNQLPYIDKIVGYRVQDLQMGLLKVLAGEIDFSHSPMALKDLPLLKEKETSGGYKVMLYDYHTGGSTPYLAFTYKDPIWRKVVWDVRFRKALSLGINRKEIIDTIYYGLAEPPKTVPSEYNPTEANRLLDEMGLKKGSDGWRLGPDGKTFIIHFETIGVWEPDMMPVNELVAEYWNKLGIKTTVKQIDPTLWWQRATEANEIQAGMYWGTPRNMCVRLGYYMSWATKLWDQWFATGGKAGEEPPTWYKTLKKLLVAKRAALPESPEYKQVEKAILDLEAKYIPAPIIAEKVKKPVIVSTKLGNIPQSGISTTVNYSLEQIFFKK